MAPGADPAFQQAMDKLMLQVNRDNVLAAHRAFQQHADNLYFKLNELRFTTSFRRCGGDPVSGDALKDDSFRGKINQLLDVHWKHWEELTAVAERLRASARDYGHTEEAILASFPNPQR